MSDVYFIRHNWNKEDKLNKDNSKIINERLFNEKRVAIHFNDTKFDNDNDSKYFEEDYYNDSEKNNKEKVGKNAIRLLNECYANDGIIVTKYKDVEKDKILIGKMKKDSKLAIPIKIYSDKKGKEKTDFIAKTIQLENPKEITIDMFPLPFLIAPPFVTIIKWESARKAISTYFNNDEKVLEKDLISPWHWEVLVEEYLRKVGILDLKLFSTGKTMEKFDIVGLTKSKELVLVQVKYTAKKHEYAKFIEYTQTLNTTHKYFYTLTPHSQLNEKSNSNFWYYRNLSDVYEYFKKDESYLKRMIFNAFQGFQK